MEDRRVPGNPSISRFLPTILDELVTFHSHLKRFTYNYKILKVLIAAGLLIWLVRSGRLDFQLLISIPFTGHHFFGLLLLMSGIILQFLRWWWLLRMQNINLSFWKTVQLAWIGQFFFLVLPGIAGAEVARSYYIAQEASGAKTAAISTVFMDRAIGLYSFLLLGTAPLWYLILIGKDLSLPVSQFGLINTFMLLGATVILFIALTPAMNHLLDYFIPVRFRDPLKVILNAYRANIPGLVFCLMLSLLINIVVFGAFEIASHFAGNGITWKQTLLVCPLIFISNILPISPGGIGIGETTASFILARFGVETGATIMLVFRIWFLLLRLPGGLIYVFGNSRINNSRVHLGRNIILNLKKKFKSQ